MTKATGFRIFGDELDRVEGYVDVAVVGTDADGNIYLEEQVSTSPEEWKLSGEELSNLYQKEHLIEEANVPSGHAVWGDIELVTTRRESLASDKGFVDERLQGAQASLFKALVEESK